MFEQAIELGRLLIVAIGALRIVQGLITFGGGISDKQGTEIKDGLYTMAGGAVVMAAAALLSSIVI